MPFRQIASKLSPKGWAMAGGALAATILFFVLVMSLASKPSYSTLLTGLDPAQTGKITSALDTKGISYQIQNNGTALAVQSSETGQARIALATAGLLGASSQPGMELLNNQPLGQSNFQQQITYQRALEGQLAQTIEQIQGVSSAQVQLVLPNPQDQLFSDNTQPATAAVLLSSSSSIDPNSVKGIAQLVSSSVPGLQASKVTITDGSGQLLWPTSDAAGTSGGLLAKQTAEERYDSTVAAQVDAMLAQTLGPGKAQAQVNADLNTNQTTQDSLTYATKGTPLQQQTSNETLTGGGGGGAGAAGTAGNIPGYAQTTGGGGNSNYQNTTSSTTFGVNKTVTHSVVSPGAINRQTVSVLIDSSVPASAIPTLKAAVASAVGLNPKRGDSISFGQVPFAKTTQTAPPKPSPMMKYAKYGVIGLGALLFLFFITRMLRRREREPFVGEPTWLRELATPRPLAAIETPAPAPEEPTQVMQLRTPVNMAKKQVEELVQRDADRVAQHVRAWMSED